MLENVLWRRWEEIHSLKEIIPLKVETGLLAEWEEEKCHMINLKRVLILWRLNTPN